MATASSSTPAPPPRAWSTRAGRTPATAYPIPTAPCRRRRSRWSRCRATSTTPRSASAELYQVAGRLDRATALRREAAELRDADSRRVLGRRARHVRARTRWRQASAAHGHQQRGASPLEPRADRRPGRAPARALSRARLLQRMGRAHPERLASGLQSDELPRRQRVAPRQRAPGARPVAVRPRAGGAAHRACGLRGRCRLGVSAAAGAVLRPEPGDRTTVRSAIR